MGRAGWPSTTGNPSGKGRDNNSSSSDDDDWVDPNPWSLSSWYSSSHRYVSRERSTQRSEQDREIESGPQPRVRLSVREKRKPKDCGDDSETRTKEKSVQVMMRPTKKVRPSFQRQPSSRVTAPVLRRPKLSDESHLDDVLNKSTDSQ